MIKGMGQSDFVQHLDYRGWFADGRDRVKTGIRVQIEIYTDHLYYLAEQDVTGDEDYLVLSEFILPFALLKDVVVDEYAHEYHGRFYALRCPRFLDWRMKDVIVDAIELPQSNGKDGRLRAETMKELILTLQKNLFAEPLFETELQIFQGKRKFMTEEYGLTPEEAWYQSEGSWVYAKYRKDSFEVAFLDRWVHFRSQELLRAMTIPGSVFDEDSLGAFDDFQSIKRIKYALGFPDLAAYRRFLKEDAEKPNPDEPLLDHNLRGIDPHQPLILMFLFGRRDSILLYPKDAKFLAWASLAKRCDQQWRYESYVERIELPAEAVDPLRKSRHDFGEY